MVPIVVAVSLWAQGSLVSPRSTSFGLGDVAARAPSFRPKTMRFPAFFCTLRFGSNFLSVLGFEVRARCG